MNAVKVLVGYISPEQNEEIEQALNDYGNERDWQKMRPYEMVGIVLEKLNIRVLREDDEPSEIGETQPDP